MDTDDRPDPHDLPDGCTQPDLLGKRVPFDPTFLDALADERAVDAARAVRRPDRFTHAEPGADYTADVDDAADAALADRIRAAGAHAWTVHHTQPDPDDVHGEHGDLDALRRAAYDATDRVERRDAYRAYIQALIRTRTRTS